MKPLWLYVSGPYTQGDPVVNVRNAVRVAEIIREAGHVPIVPHLSMLWHMISPHEWDYWLDLDLALLERCDGMVRISGDSKGADREQKVAQNLGMVVITIKGDQSGLDYLRHSLTITNWTRAANRGEYGP